VQIRAYRKGRQTATANTTMSSLDHLSMYAWRLAGPGGSFTYEQVPIPDVRSGTVLVRMEATPNGLLLPAEIGRLRKKERSASLCLGKGRASAFSFSIRSPRSTSVARRTRSEGSRALQTAGGAQPGPSSEGSRIRKAPFLDQEKGHIVRRTQTHGLLRLPGRVE